ncbi:hypothetical protein MJH12_02480, partial [bacterium]|nr:hypothetical protein [bacterium]
MKKILFRADAHEKIGTGDLASLIQLSMYCEELGWHCDFLTKNSSSAQRLLESYQISQIHWMSDYIAIEDEVNHINLLLKQHDYDIIFFEITDTAYEKYRFVEKQVFKACVCFDGKVDHSFDFLLDWGIDAKNLYKHLNPIKTTLLLGPKYVILPYQFDFKKIDQKVLDHSSSKKVLIMMGGGDEFNLTCKILRPIINDKNLRIT